MIPSFSDRDPAGLFDDRLVRRFAGTERAARRKLLLRHAARVLGSDIEKRVRMLAA